MDISTLLTCGTLALCLSSYLLGRFGRKQSTSGWKVIEDKDGMPLFVSESGQIAPETLSRIRKQWDEVWKERSPGSMAVIEPKPEDFDSLWDSNDYMPVLKSQFEILSKQAAVGRAAQALFMQLEG